MVAKYEYPSSIKDAAYILDVEISDWYKRFIDPDVYDNINMNDVQNCILGIVFGNYNTGMYRLFKLNNDDDGSVGFESYLIDSIFGSNADIGSWKNQISKRLIESHSIPIEETYTGVDQSNAQFMIGLHQRLKHMYNNIPDSHAKFMMKSIINDIRSDIIKSLKEI